MIIHHKSRSLGVSRSGNTLILAMGILVLASGVLLVSTTTAQSASKSVLDNGLRELTLAAAEAVAARQETTIATYANGGDPTAWVNMTDAKIAGNYGETWVGNIRVQWKVEPAVASSVATTSGVGWNYIVNPAPDTTTTTAAPRVVNDATYLFRIAAEATYRDGKTSSSKVLARAQSIRFASADKLPLFRYVIFYAKNGPKGDLEFSHGPGVKIRGNVHSNGAIYLGGGTQVNDYTALLRSAAGTVTDPASPLYNEDGNATIIGQDINNKNVRICGVDGIFRLSKQVPLGAFNLFPMAGISPAGSMNKSWYSVAAAPAQGEGGSSPNYASPLLTGSTLADVTLSGRVINPNRITDMSGLVTRDIINTDTMRKINGVAIRGKSTGVSVGSADTDANDANKANDSRDVTRTKYSWQTDSLKAAAPGFSGYARSNANGGAVVPLAHSMLNRPFEAQAIVMPTYNSAGALATLSDATTPDQAFLQDNPKTPDIDEAENHWNAMPLFVTSAGTQTAVLPIVKVVEKAGSQLQSALGRNDIYFKRRTAPAFVGWDITKADGSGAGADKKPVGLIIRERPVPDPTFTATLSFPTTLSPDYMPYVYGKPRPGLLPFLPVDLCDSMHSFDFNSNFVEGPYDTKIRSETVANQMQAYSLGGKFVFSAANRPGPDAVPSALYTRRAEYYRENWRMFNLKNLRTTGASPTYAVTPGLRATYFTKSNFSGPCYVRSDSTINFDWGGLEPMAGLPVDNFSVRWEGSITAPSSGSYVFKTLADDVCRIWINGVRVLNQTAFTGSISSGDAIQLESQKSYSFMVEMVEQAGFAKCQVYWSHPTSGGDQIIPASAFKMPYVGSDSSLSNFKREAFFRLRDFKAVQMKIESFTNYSTPNAKVALMIQDALGGTTPYTMSGASPYAAVCYTPQRGFFMQFRGLPAAEEQKILYYVGAGTENGLPAPAGQVVDPLTCIRSGKLTLATDALQPVVSTLNAEIIESKFYSPFTKVKNPWTTSEGTVDLVLLGPVTATWTKTPQASYTETSSRNITWTASALDSSGKFSTSSPDDRTSPINLYTYPSGMQNPTPSIILPKWELTNPTTVSITLYGTSNSGGVVAWGAPTTKSVSFGNSKTIYSPYPKYYNGGSFVRNATGQETVNYMNANYGAGYALATTADTPFFTEPDAATLKPGHPPLTTALNNPITYPAGSFYFAVPRAIMPTVDLNSYVTRWGPWFTAPQFQWLPTLTSNATWASIGYGNGFTPTPASPLMVKANSYRPDSWYSKNWSPTTPPAPPIDGSAPQSLVGSPRWLDDLPAGAAPAGPSSTNEVWLRIEKVGSNLSNSTKVRFLYYVGPSTPVVSNFVPIKNGTEDVVVDLASFAQTSAGVDAVTYLGASLKPYSVATDRCLLIGPAIQSGNAGSPAKVTISSLAVETNFTTGKPAPNNDFVWNAAEWEGNASGTNDMSLYLASQYQVFFGSQEITEDFFSYNQATSANRLATEDWIYNPREFWSQSKWWDGNTNTGRQFAKESTTQGNGQPNFLPSGGTSQRELFAKMSLLTLNLQAIQDYLRTRTLTQAVVKSLSTSAVLPQVAASDPKLSSNFNKLIYAARTNRYPVNPQMGSSNPWNPDLPNSTSDIADLNTATVAAVKAMQPYSLPYAPAMRSQQFFQAVRIVNGAELNWERPISGTPDFGNSKLSIVTPGQLIIQGNLNYVNGTWPAVMYKGVSSTGHPAPLAIMGDAITFLSNSFDDNLYKIPNLKVTDSEVLSGGTLAYGSASLLPVATETSYYTAIVTNNQPTTKDSVMNGEAASFINVMTFLENWNAVKMNYTGSLVVLDTRRYANSYLLEAPKNYGWGPFGFHLTSTASSGWKTTWGIGSINAWDNPTFALPNVQGAPNRVLSFNYDLLTEQGTPPFTPFGVSVAGRGGWTKIIE